jgi:hypothetical protein
MIAAYPLTQLFWQQTVSPPSEMPVALVEKVCILLCALKFNELQFLCFILIAFEGQK